MGDLPYIEWLARRYKQRGEHSGQWTDYLKAHGLANFIVASDCAEERCELVYDIERSWYGGEHPIGYIEHQELTNNHKQSLNEYRHNIGREFDSVEEEGEELDDINIFSEKNMKEAAIFCDHLFVASQRASDEFVGLSKRIIQSSVNILKHANMAAPCGFAVVGLGSVAKGEATPYSDLEYAFIVEHEDEYFEKLAMDSYFRIGNLGETPLKCFDVEELKVEKRCPPIIADLDKVGYRIDGITERAGNIPTGNGRKDGQPLTLTVNGFMDLYKASAESPFGGMAGDKSDMLSSLVVIWTNEGKRSKLYDDFMNARIEYEQTIVKHNEVVKKKRLDSFIKDINSYTFLPDFVKYQPPKNLNIKVKADIFRYPTLLANNIKMCLGLNFTYPWETYSHLHTCGILTAENYRYINIVLALSICMRTRAYLHEKSQTEFVSLDEFDFSSYMKALYQLPNSMFVILGCLLIPIKQAIKTSIEVESCKVWSLDQLVKSMLRDIHINKTDYMLKVEVRYFCGQYDNAKDELSWGIAMPIDTITCSKFLDILHESYRDSHSVHKYVELCCYLLYYTQKYASALTYFRWLINANLRKTGFWKLLSAHCEEELGNYKMARQLLTEAENSLVRPEDLHNSTTLDLVKSSFGPDTMHEDVSISLYNIGYVFLEMGEYKEALAYRMSALKMDIEMYGEVDHPRISKCYKGIGSAYLAMGNFTLALQWQLKSLAMMQNIHGVGTNHSDLSKIHSSLGTTYCHLGQYKVGLEHLINSLEMDKDIYGADAKNSSIAINYENIGNAYKCFGDCATSLEYYQMALEIKKEIYGTDTNHPKITECYNNIGNAYNTLGDYELALEYHKKSLVMMKAIYGGDTNHPVIATSYNNIGNTYCDLGNYTVGLEQYTKAFEMEKAIYGVDTNHPLLAHTCHNIGLAYSNLGDSKLALEYMHRSLAIQETVYGANTHHADIASVCNSIANMYSDLGEYKKSLEYHKKSLEMTTAIYGADTDHPDVADSYNNIGSLYSDMGDYKLAIEYGFKSLQMNVARYGLEKPHPNVAGNYTNIGCAYSDLGEYVTALDYYKKSLEVQEAVYGEDTKHPDIAGSYINIGGAYSELGDYVAAIEHHTKALEILKDVFGADAIHPEIAACLTNIGEALDKKGQYSMALENHQKALAMMSTVYDSDSNQSDLAVVYSNIGTAYKNLGDYTLALEYHTKSLKIKQDIYGTDTNHAGIAHSYNSIGVTKWAMGEYMEALKEHMKALEMMLSLFGGDTKHPKIAQIYSDIGDVYRDMGDTVKTQEYCNKALNMKESGYNDNS